jgi:glucosamine 6-phosphate synthetase-like amidotransferase/phosphosugar isomerase protein
MCGIIGYIGGRKAQEVLLKGLSRLEYRGYDSAGVAILDERKIRMVKRQGKLKVLAGELAARPAIPDGLPTASRMILTLTRTPTARASSSLFITALSRIIWN